MRLKYTIDIDDFGQKVLYPRDFYDTFIVNEESDVEALALNDWNRFCHNA